MAQLSIGLTYTGADEKHMDYANWLRGDDAIEIVRLEAGADNAARVKELHAVVMSGGIDVHPGVYGKDIHYLNAPATFNETRDQFEISVFEASQQYQKPLLGICRGMQLFNCVLGGDLVQDLGEQGNGIHRNTGVDQQHAVAIVHGTLLHKLSGITNGTINSAHHQCVNRLGNGLIATAHSADGIIEAVEWEYNKNKSFLLGIQWHPERMYKLGLQELPLSKAIRNAFINYLVSQKQINVG